MNRLGEFAENAWRTQAPSRYAQIENPKEHFSALGEEAADQVAMLTRQLQGPDQPGESFFDKVGRINMAKMQAEEIVRAEMLTPPQEQWEDQDETEDDWVSPFEEFNQLMNEGHRLVREHR